MPKGKPWTVGEEARLRKLAEEEKPVGVIAAELGKSKGAVREKARRLGVVVFSSRRKKTTTSEIEIPERLKSVEEVLKVLSGALDAAAQKGLDSTDIQRLQVVATVARTYETIFADYVDYRAIEERLKDLEVKYAALAEERTKNSASR